MKITAIETYPVQIPLKPERRMKSSLGQHIVSPYLIVKVVTDNAVERRNGLERASADRTHPGAASPRPGS